MESKKCNCCTEPCPMADMAHEAAKGRMYATKEFIALQKKIESGQLVEVVRCKDCKHKDTWTESKIRDWFWCGVSGLQVVEDMDFCSYGERKENERS
nr:MAG TPA: hypothetical protein [Caudoviricetes sp.]